MRRYKNMTALLSVSAVAAIGLTACGGGDSGEVPIVVTGQTETLTKEEFITQADGLCDGVNSQIQDIADAGEGITRAADVANLRSGLASDIRGLGTPVDDGSSSADVSTFPGDSTDGTETTDTGSTSLTPGTTDSTGATTDSSSSSGTSGTSTSSSTTATGATSGDPLEDFLTALQQEAAAGEKIDLANQRGEDTSAGESDLAAAKDQAGEAASAYGFQVCGTDDTTSQDTSEPTISDSSGTSDPGTSVAPSTVTPSAPSTDSGGSSSSGSSGSGSSSGSDGSSSGGVGAGGGVGPG